MDLIGKYKKYLADRYFVWSSVLSLLLLALSLAVNFLASLYATRKQSSPVTDIVLSNIPNYDVADIFVYGIVSLIVFVFFLLLLEPEKIPFVVKSTAVFILIRSVFISLTHIGLYPNIIESDIDVFKGITSGGDLFFSGHAGFPFLLALIFWREKNFRYLFIFISVFFGAIALMGHYHYSIDVLSAFFITFGIYHICLKIFKRDHQILLNGI